MIKSRLTVRWEPFSKPFPSARTEAGLMQMMGASWKIRASWIRCKQRSDPPAPGHRNVNSACPCVNRQTYPVGLVYADRPQKPVSSSDGALWARHSLMWNCIGLFSFKGFLFLKLGPFIGRVTTHSGGPQRVPDTTPHP